MSRTFRNNRKTGASERDSYHRNTHASRSCGHHGGCPYCESTRTHANRRRDTSKLQDSGSDPGRVLSNRDQHLMEN